MESVVKVKEHRSVNGKESVIHRETSADLVMMEDGRTLQETMNDLTAAIASLNGVI